MVHDFLSILRWWRFWWSKQVQVWRFCRCQTQFAVGEDEEEAHQLVQISILLPTQNDVGHQPGHAAAVSTVPVALQ